MLNASPRRRAPGVGMGSAGMLRFGIVLMLPFSTAERKASRISIGTCGATVVLRCLAMSPLASEGSFEPGTSTKQRTSELLMG